MAIETQPQPPREPVVPVPHEVLIVGGSYGGLNAIHTLLAFIDGKHAAPNLFPEALLNIKSRRGIHITLVDERDGFFHTVGTPLAHCSREHCAPFWRKYRNILELQRDEVTVRRGSVKHIDCESLVATFDDMETTGREFRQRYDYLVLATGMRRDWPTVPRAFTKAEYVKDGTAQIAGIEESAGDGIVVIGGGAVGIEMAAEIKHNHPSKNVILIHSRNELLSNEPLPAEFKERALAISEEGGVRVILGQRATVVAQENGTSTVTLTDGRVIEAGKVVTAIHKWTPVSSALSAEALTVDGYVKVNSHMNISSGIPNAGRHFAIGDVVEWSGIRRAGAAMFMGRVAATNVFSMLLVEETPERQNTFSEFPEVPPMMALAVGSQTVTYGPKQGVKYGKELMQTTFGTDLGWSNTLRHIGLTEVEDK
ncbi:putative apoptosis inducing protein [Neofusicoccum parvum UCRNP2]|uniref:Putative apoptosis inducing protein n=1 Tax=Botryosphaeria parva (strain UCR-NP2) TaxID=1287680 RepID=R1GEE5_BOTPV|nr:putative apoptosis inducing protein [Neofusicoccum parvum UCRNP2]